MLTSVLIDSNVEMARALVTEWNSLRAEECAAVLGAMLQTMAVVAERTSVKPLTAVQIQTRAAGYVIEELEFQAHRQNDSLEQALADLAWPYRLHLVLGFTMFLVFPFSRLVHIWSAPVGYVFRSYQIVRRRGGGRHA